MILTRFCCSTDARSLSRTELAFFSIFLVFSASSLSSPLTPTHFSASFTCYPSSLQVVDGFFVKRVQDVRESAAYLTVMTRYLSKLYQVCVLSSGPSHSLRLVRFKLNSFLSSCRTAR